MPSRWTGFRARINRYAAFVRHVAVDGLWRYRRRVLLAWITGGLSVALQVVALTVALKYARYFGDDESITLLGLTIRVRESVWLLLACGASVLVALLVAAAAVYVSKRQALAVWREYARLCTMRALSILGGGGTAPRLGPQAPDDSRLMTHLRNECLLAGRVLMLLVGMATPSVQLLVATAALLWLEPLLTLILMVMAAAAAVFLFRVNVGGTNQSLLMEKLSPAASQEYRRILQRHRWSAATDDAGHAEQDQELIDGTIGQYNRAYLGRYEMVNRSDFIGAMLLAVAVCLMLVMVGGRIMRDGLGWQRLVVYLVALRFAMTSFRDVANRLTGVNLFYGQVGRHYRFLKEAAAFRPPDSDAPPPPDIEPGSDRIVELKPPSRHQHEITIDQPQIEGSLTRLTISPGTRLALVGPLEVNRYTLAFLLGRLLGHGTQAWGSAVDTARFVSSRAVLNGSTLRSALGIGSNVDHLSLQARIPDVDVRGLLDLPRADMAPWTSLAGQQRNAVMLWALAESEARWLFIDADVLDSPAQLAMLEKMKDRIVVIEHHATAERVGQFGEHAVLVLDHARLTGMGGPDWAAANRATIESMVRTTVASGGGSGTRDDLLDFDLEE